MRGAFLIFALLLVCSIVAGDQYEYEYDNRNADSSNSSPEVSSDSSSTEEIIDTDQIEIIEGSGSGDEPPSVRQINILGILPGPGDIRKKRDNDLSTLLLRK